MIICSLKKEPKQVFIVNLQFSQEYYVPHNMPLSESAMEDDHRLQECMLTAIHSSKEQTYFFYLLLLFLFIYWKMLASISYEVTGQLNTACLCRSNTFYLLSVCVLSLSVVMDHSRPGRANSKKKIIIWSENAWPQPWGAEGQHTGDHFCVRVRDIKKGPFLSEPKWGWGIGLNIFVPPNESGSLIFAGHMGCEAKPSGDDTGRWMLASLKRRQGK